MLPTVRRTWGLRGQTPILRHRLRGWGKVSCIGALTLSPRRRRAGLYLGFHPQANIAQPQMIAFLKDLARHLRGEVILIWDRWQVHRGRRVRAYLERQRRLHVEWLPPYAPDLNPMDKGWSWMKGHALANYAPEHLGQLRAAVRRTGRKLQDQPRLLRSFIHAAKLPIRL